ncbi:MAG TPA: hypothetical protein PLP61_16800, partial [Nocardioides sp.]|uniref:hypothetical protein n=1 Tax=Nocardioides sp. TaxID=35761 RepID=UPI002C4E72C6
MAPTKESVAPVHATVTVPPVPDQVPRRVGTGAGAVEEPPDPCPDVPREEEVGPGPDDGAAEDAAGDAGCERPGR